MDDEQLLAFVRNGCRFGGGKKPAPGRAAGSDGRQNDRQQQRLAGPGSQAAGRGGVPPRGCTDIRCINCAGTGHSCRACPRPELRKDQRTCLLCKTPGRLAAACPNKPALALQGDQPSAAPGSAQRSFEIGVAESEGAEKRVRGMPIEHMFDAQGFQVVRRGFISWPRGAQLGDFCAAPHSRMSQDDESRLDTPLCSDVIFSE